MNARKVRTAVGLGEIRYGSMIHVDQSTIALKGSKDTGFFDRYVVNRAADENGGRLSIMMMVQTFKRSRIAITGLAQYSTFNSRVHRSRGLGPGLWPVVAVGPVASGDWRTALLEFGN